MRSRRNKVPASSPNMAKNHKKDRWLEDIEARQSNVVFPDTVQNEARFWRNLKDIPWKTSTKIGMAILALFVGTWISIILFATLQQGIWTAVALAAGMLLIFGPIFALIVWATRRSLRNIQNARRGQSR
jgi:hypothetical protein